ncbi:AAA-ATPase-like domain-containing protein [Tuber indicum]|nr:AAA-ATPase-like domain-containing protein [Tuber indicum]
MKHQLYNVKGIYLLADEYDACTNEYMDSHNGESWSGSNVSSLVKDFVVTMKGMVDLPYGIQKCFITGISPLSLANITSGFNISVNMSFEKEVAGLCGLSHADAEGAMEKICKSKAKVERHQYTLTRYDNGYHFCRYRKSELVFITDKSLEYLQASIRSILLESSTYYQFPTS